MIATNHPELAPAPAWTANRFQVSSTGLAWEVVDHDGRPVTGVMSYRVARDAADTLNTAARRGRDSLAAALGCIED